MVKGCWSSYMLFATNLVLIRLLVWWGWEITSNASRRQPFYHRARRAKSKTETCHQCSPSTMAALYWLWRWVISRHKTLILCQTETSKGPSQQLPRVAMKVITYQLVMCDTITYDSDKSKTLLLVMNIRLLTYRRDKSQVDTQHVCLEEFWKKSLSCLCWFGKREGLTGSTE